MFVFSPYLLSLTQSIINLKMLRTIDIIPLIWYNLRVDDTIDFAFAQASPDYTKLNFAY